MENNLLQTPNSTATNPQPVSQQQPIATNKSSLPMILGGLALLIVGLVGGYYLGISQVKDSVSEEIVIRPITSPEIPEEVNPNTRTPQETANIYENTEYGISFTLKEDESVVPCVNQNEYNDNVALSVRKNMPVGFDPADYCATDGSAGQIFLSKKAYGEESIEAHLEMLRGEGYEYNITTSPITISGVTGVRVTGNRDDAIPAPLPPTVDEGVFERNGAFYIIPAEYLERDFSFIN